MTRWPTRHLLMHYSAGNSARLRALSYRLTGPVLVWAHRQLRAAARAYWQAPTRANYVTIERWLTRLGVWQSTPLRSYDHPIVFDPQLLAKNGLPSERVVAHAGMPYIQFATVGDAYHRNLRDKRVLALPAGGIGDFIMFSQVCQNIRARYGTTIDTAFYPDNTDQVLVERLAYPGKALPLPLAETEFRTYNCVLPLGMYKIASGETPSEYFFRSFGIEFSPVGFPDDPIVDDNIDIRLRHRHGFDLEHDRLVFIQARCRGEKNYPFMIEVAKLLIERGHQVVMIGGVADCSLTDQPRKLANLCGLGFWPTLRALRHASLVITPDSSFMHGAGALKKPALALFGPSPTLWAEPYPNTTAVIFSTVCAAQPCWVAEKQMPPCGHFHNRPCLTEMPATAIADLAERKLAGEELPRIYELPLMPKRQFTRS